MDSRAVRVLLVEDNSGDSRLIERGLREWSRPVLVERAKTADEARNALFGTPSASIDLVLLDLRIPGGDGLDVLRDIRRHGAMQHVPVVVLTASLDGTDVRASYANEANHYLSKPADPEPFVARVRALEAFYASRAASSPGSSLAAGS